MPATPAAPVALITGSAKRIGAAIARALHADGYDLALHYRGSGEAMAALAAELEAARPGSTLTLQADLAEFDRLPELIARTVGRYGRLDALVNNASGFAPTPIGSATPAQWDAMFASNARAPFFLAQAAAPHLKAARGAIVNLADIYAERPLRDHSLYCMAKAALVMATRALALELAPEVRVNAVAPGAILWPEAEGAKDEAAKAAMLARTPLGRTGSAEEIAEAVRWLLREARYTTGQVLRVDGGRLLGE
ncbi:MULTISPECIES: pteridine reductase [unclassified Lysobacter]|uniref:pteridine reductase n=1 Tax=unclassified Lysobacter TaxID=2635362 RepID=UPI00070F6A54|nr:MULTISPECIES: pteridine reductase [unclassified Lysobacter]KRD32122.1 pteridine reductase [Lysobacter sp. Root916]KRD75996.1 pteridine reductase [Lysobacter sp. Root983]